MSPLVFEGLLGVMTRGTPEERMSGLTRFVTGHLADSAAAVTCVDRGRHRLVASSGYRPPVIDYLLTEFVESDPGMKVVQREPTGILTWRDIPDYRTGHTVQDILQPAGFDEGTSIALTGEQGEMIGAVHVSVAQHSVPHWVKALLAEVRPVAADTVTMVRGQREVALSTREGEVLPLMARGMSNAEIATALFISRSTVNSHVEHILAKLGAANRVCAVVRAIELGLL